MGQTWMEDFKAQQAALGVAQGQLADMAGFSRGYLNRLLNRSQELPERYKARLTAALEKMQPDTITVKIDYVRIRFLRWMCRRWSKTSCGSGCGFWDSNRAAFMDILPRSILGT